MASTFSAVKQANALIRETTTANDASIDIGPASRRLTYDIEAVEKDIAALVAAHPGELVSHAEAIEDVAQLTSKIPAELHNVSNAYSKLEKDFVVPFEQARDAHKAAVKLEQMAGLARALAWYLHLAKQIDAGQEERASLDTVVQAAKCYPQIKQLVEQTPSLAGLAVVRQLEPTLAPAGHRLETVATAAVREGIDKRRLYSGLTALEALDVDISTTVDTMLKAHIGTSVLQLSRSSSTSPEAFNDSVSEAKRRAKTLGLIEGILADLKRPTTPLVDYFWTQVAKNMDVKLKTMSVANQAAIKSMSVQRNRFFKSLESVPPLRAVFEKYIISG